MLLFQAGNPDELDMVENEELEIIANGDGDGWVRVSKRWKSSLLSTA